MGSHFFFAHPERGDCQPISPLDRKFIRRPSRNLSLAVSNVVQGKSYVSWASDRHHESWLALRHKIFLTEGLHLMSATIKKSRLLDALRAHDVLAANSMCAHM